MHGIICIGDSIVFGRGDLKNRGWCGRLQKDFEKIDPYNAVFNLGMPGDTTQDLLKRFEIEIKARAKQVWPGDKYQIIIGIGGNDACCIGQTARHRIMPDRFKQNLNKLLELAQKYVESKKSILLYGTLPVDESKVFPYEKYYFKNEWMEEYNNIIKEACKEHNIPFIDFFKEWITDPNRLKLLDDGLHPNSKGYQKMFERIREIISELKK